MSTRGAIGFRIDGKDKLTYNHSDSYPSWLGVQVLKFLKEHRSNLETLKEQAAKLKFTPTSRKPTPEEIAICEKAGAVNLGVSKSSTDDWYCLTRNAQGDLGLTLKIGFMANGNNFVLDSLFCEWAYIINFDTMKLEVYKGFNHGKPAPSGGIGQSPISKWVPEHTGGRYAEQCDVKGNQHYLDRGESPYFGVALVAEYPLRQLPAETRFLKEVEPSEEE